MPQLNGNAITIRPLRGGLTNRNYMVRSGGQQFVLRIGGENSALLGIDRHAEHLCARLAFQAGISPEVLAFLPEHEAMLTRFLPGRTLRSRNLRSTAILHRLVRSLRKYHESPGGVGTFAPFQTIRRYYLEAKKRKAPFPSTMTRALEVLERIEQMTEAPNYLYNCHNDLLPGNFIHDGCSIWILDWEYSAKGDLFFDLGNLAANNRFSPEQEATLLRFYFGAARTSDLQRLRLMRLVSEMREATWGFLQTRISTINIDYRGYALVHLGRFLSAVGRMVSPKNSGSLRRKPCIKTTQARTHSSNRSGRPPVSALKAKMPKQD
jgi:thiamine kinase-like enzyme